MMHDKTPPGKAQPSDRHQGLSAEPRVSTVVHSIGTLDTAQYSVELETKAKQRFSKITITEKAPIRAFSWCLLTSAFTFKTLLRHYANQPARPL